MQGLSFYRRVGAIVLGLFMIVSLGVFTDPAPAQAAPSSSFTDVKDEHAFKLEITWLAEMGVTTGYDTSKGKKQFRPKGTITREAMAAFLYRLSEKPKFTPPKKSPFKDVPTSHTFYKEITWLAQTGVTTGYPDGTFRPRNKITREAMSAFLFRFSGDSGEIYAPRLPFDDVRSNHKFYKEITWMANSRITEGYYRDGKSEFRPRNNVTREAAAAFLFRYHESYAPWRTIRNESLPYVWDDFEQTWNTDMRHFRIKTGDASRPASCSVGSPGYFCYGYKLPECSMTSGVTGVYNLILGGIGAHCDFHPYGIAQPGPELKHYERVAIGRVTCTQYEDLTHCHERTYGGQVLMKNGNILATKPYLKLP